MYRQSAELAHCHDFQTRHRSIKVQLSTTSTLAVRLAANDRAINHQLVIRISYPVPDTNTPTPWATFPHMNVV